MSLSQLSLGAYFLRALYAVGILMPGANEFLSCNRQSTFRWSSKKVIKFPCLEVVRENKHEDEGPGEENKTDNLVAWDRVFWLTTRSHASMSKNWHETFNYRTILDGVLCHFVSSCTRYSDDLLNVSNCWGSGFEFQYNSWNDHELYAICFCGFFVTTQLQSFHQKQWYFVVWHSKNVKWNF